MIGLKSKRKYAAQYYMASTRVRESGIFSIHISRFLLQSTCRMVPSSQKEQKVRLGHVTKYISSKMNATFEETIKAGDVFQKQTVKISQFPVSAM
jgi:hypothetical protein